VALLAFPSRLCAGPEIPGAPQDRPVALIGGTVHPVEGPDIAGATLVFSQGRIVALGTEVDVPQDAQQIDVSGQHVYPGLINAAGRLGLVEINAVRSTVDYQETGQINPNAKAQVAVNPDSELIPVTRANGVLLALTSPVGGLISGTSAVIQLDGWTWEDMTLKAPVGMHIQWPSAPSGRARDPEARQRQRASQQEELELLEKAFQDAAAYRAARQSGEYQKVDIRWEAMLPVLEGSVPIIVEADQLAAMEAAVAFAARHRLRLIIRGGYDALHCAELLKEHQVPVIVQSVHRLPLRRSDPYDAPYALPQKLHAAGIAYCIAAPGSFDAANLRNLPYEAATAVAYGLPADEGLKAITLYAAQVLGIDDRVGSLAVGKDATLIVTSGDPLETDTQIQQAWIQGREVDLSNRHKRLWQKYQEKYRRLEQEESKEDNAG
jgi:imidazolonepropionase-like amidohydrolase